MRVSVVFPAPEGDERMSIRNGELELEAGGGSDMPTFMGDLVCA
jgi:hypothetical protein